MEVFDPDAQGGEFDEGQKSYPGLVERVATPELLELRGEVLDPIAGPISRFVVLDRLAPVLLGGDDRQSPVQEQPGPEMVGVVAAVSHHASTSQPRSLQQRGHSGQIVTLLAGQGEGERQPVRVLSRCGAWSRSRRVSARVRPLRCAAPLARLAPTACWWPHITVETSIWTRSRATPALAMAAKTASNTP